MSRRTLFRRLALLATALTLGVVVLGGYVRLSDAGLGCPDWPGCYGHWVVPAGPETVEQANALYPERPLEAAKGWKEMVHRYFAGTLGLLVLALALIALRNRREPSQPVALPVFLVALIIFQSILGMWTVTWQLKPVVVMAHLLGGLSTLGLLAWLTLRQSGWWQGTRRASSGLRWAALIGLLVVVAQIALGGWTSANYAALACTDFPTCHQQWWPEADFDEAFVLWRGLGANYEYGVLDNPARVAIQLTHRIGAVVTAAYLLALAALVLRSGHVVTRGLAWAMLGLLALQFSLGIANVLLSLPLPVAVAHNAGAALLLLSLITLNHSLRPPPTLGCSPTTPSEA
ncbi:COX15/CtaA family protein [Alkalilimnicola sp. S0819]|uniref:COX15/CtaA family protein n=1 Tax=Alkalilimnicola sp. S0819 TaxID=2613922 RepID=UPI0012617D97|nr:COX15/CtaA family protein [Alkalilimnicola sp. S0819]KAB7624440.1 heme A synthase [Alkalilimnicola sp. S0819]MPQ16273.1 heme A synthase [Alkalilimnicola sp. S0819]